MALGKTPRVQHFDVPSPSFTRFVSKFRRRTAFGSTLDFNLFSRKSTVLGTVGPVTSEVTLNHDEMQDYAKIKACKCDDVITTTTKERPPQPIGGVGLMKSPEASSWKPTQHPGTAMKSSNSYLTCTAHEYGGK